MVDCRCHCSIIFLTLFDTPGLLKTRILEDFKRKILSDHRFFTVSQFDKFYHNTKGVVWNGNTTCIEILNV